MNPGNKRSRTPKRPRQPRARNGARARADAFADGLHPPLVSLVVINWNYAQFVGQTIESIKVQDYPWFEAIVVDNGSDDDSLKVIRAHIAGDGRFRIIELERNLGHLGGFLRAVGEIRGDFVTAVDADDTLFPNFVSSHVQVHLAAPQNVGLTSSNVVETTADGRVVTGSYAPFGTQEPPDSAGLRPAGAAFRMPQVSDADYVRLAGATQSFTGPRGWIWGAGTSNMYRRSIVNMVHFEPPDGVCFRAVDGHLCTFAHAIGGTALIDLPLSAYRIHDANDFALRESIGGLSPGRSKVPERVVGEGLKSLGILFERAELFGRLLPGERFWRAADQVGAAARNERGKFTPSADGAQPFSEHFETLVSVFGEKVAIIRLAERLRRRHLEALLREKSNGRIPPRQRIRAYRTYARLAWRRRAAAGKTLSRELSGIASKARASLGKAFAKRRKTGGGAPPVEEVRTGFGPAVILSADPPILYSGIAFEEYAGIAPAFGRRYGDVPAGFIIFPCWTIDQDRRAGLVIEAARAHRAQFPSHRLVFICNTAGERDRLLAGGLDARLLNKNFTVSDAIFRPLPEASAEFDAVFNARFDPRKRHELAGDIPRVAYISFATGLTGTLDDQRALLADTLARHPGHALINPLEDGLPVPLSPEEVNAGLNRAAVGLCLSREEGANYASMEYMLAGLPVVSTPSVGGREVYFDHEICTICDPTPEAVAEAVAVMKARNLPRDHVRARALAMIEPERRKFLNLIDDLSERLGGKRRYGDGVWPFSDTSNLVTLKAYGEHLDDLDRRRKTPLRDPARPSLADAEALLAKTEGVQMHANEVHAVMSAIRARPGCALLVFGCGNDSPLWEEVNRGGVTAFVENDARWAERVRGTLKTSSIHLTEYGTGISDWVSLLDDPDRLALDLPAEISSRQWDVILVDGPAGHDDFEEYGGETPGRMKSIFAASQLVAPGGAVFVHDCERTIEEQYATRYLGAHRVFASVTGRALLRGYAF
ncbi:MAG: glycosyltransferase [Flavobacteriaceae bacterium]